MRERDLRESLRAIGPQLPLARYDGHEIDGRRRAKLCAELGLRIETRDCRTLAEACSFLWVHHPARALELAGARPLLELVQLCGASASAVARELAAAKPKRKHIKRFLGEQDGPGPTKIRVRSRESRGAKGVKLELWVEPAFKAYVDECSRIERLSLSGLMREALWARIALTVPRAPLHPPGGKEKRKAS